MEIKGSWSSENKPSNHVENMDFSSLVGVWNACIKIYITNPHIYSNGCIVKSGIRKQ